MTQKTLDTSRLDERSRIIIPKEARELLGLSAADREKDIKGDLVAIVWDEKAKKVYIEKMP